MPFGLKNAGATYQRLVTKMFQEYLGKTMEVYIDDMLVKSTQAEDHFQHLSPTFEILRRYSMKLNLEKCVFGVASSKFLGFLVSDRGIEVNPAQIKNIEEIPDILTSKKEVQRLTGSKITEFFQSWQIKRITSSPYHPVENGQAESTNKIIINNLKKRLEKSKGNWPEELPGVLWAYRTTTKIATGETSFSLVYGSEALIPVEIGEPSTRFTLATEESNDEELRTNLDLLEQRREAALIRMETQKQIIERYYNRKAHLRYFKIRDFVLKKGFQSTKTTGEGKLNPNWERPYKVLGIAGKGAYELETMDGKVLPSRWNVVHLKKYYF
nr:uncharacterized protein LOC104104822 [Nicotiana tomentosiformis]